MTEVLPAGKPFAESQGSELDDDTAKFLNDDDDESTLIESAPSKPNDKSERAKKITKEPTPRKKTKVNMLNYHCSYINKLTYINDHRVEKSFEACQEKTNRK